MISKFMETFFLGITFYQLEIGPLDTSISNATVGVLLEVFNTATNGYDSNC